MKSLLKKILFVSFCLLFIFNPEEIFSQKPNDKDDYHNAINKFGTIYQLINIYYTDTVNNNELIEGAIRKMLEELDPHSVYMDAKEAQAANEPLAGNFEGIGIQYQMLKDTLVVISPITGGPSEKVGIIAGDKIVEIDGQNATGKSITTSWIQSHLKGPKGTPVKVKVVRQDYKELLDFTIIRDVIPLYSIDAYYMVSDNIGYVKLSKFARTSVDEFNEAVNKLRAKGMKKLILDLRNNSGGYLDIAISLADEFLPAGKLIVYTQGRNSPRKDAIATSVGNFETDDVVVLINEGSASASEILSGAIQDWDRGTIIGRRSFGKGLVQRPFTLNDSSQIRLTIARYYTPSGRCIQKPYKNGSEAYFNDLENRYKHGEFENADSISFPDSLKYYTSGGRVVYGGGGIMPDIFVPYDTTSYSSYYKKLNIKGILVKFTSEYVDGNRKSLSKHYASSDDFIKSFVVNDDLMKKFFNFAENAGVPYDADGYQKSKNIIDTQIKALIGRDLFDIGTYFEVVNSLSDEYNIAIKTLKNKSNNNIIK